MYVGLVRTRLFRSCAINCRGDCNVCHGASRRTIVDKFVDNLAALVESRMPQRTQVKLKVMRGKQVKLNMPQRTQVETSFRLELHWSATGAHWS